jgi:hypothetical protein
MYGDNIEMYLKEIGSDGVWIAFMYLRIESDVGHL